MPIFQAQNSVLVIEFTFRCSRGTRFVKAHFQMHFRALELKILYLKPGFRCQSSIMQMHPFSCVMSHFSQTGVIYKDRHHSELLGCCRESKEDLTAGEHYDSPPNTHRKTQSTELEVKQDHHVAKTVKDHLSGKQEHTVKPTERKAGKNTSSRHNYRSMKSSGYGTMSTVSGDQPVFRIGDEFEPVSKVGKMKDIASAYMSRVKVEEEKGKAVALDTEKEHVLSKAEADMYNHLKATYIKTAAKARNNRKEKFFRKLQDVQLDAALQHNKELAEKQRRKEEMKRRQNEQLRHIRQKFEDERAKRYKTQYITKNFLNYEKMDRSEYGLPEPFMKDTQHETKLKRTGGVKITALAFVKKEVKLKKTYGKMFEEVVVPSSDPKMEGKDQVTIDVTGEEGECCI